MPIKKYKYFCHLHTKKFSSLKFGDEWRYYLYENLLGNHIIISAIEHSSVVAPVNYLVSNGFDVSIIPLDSEGQVNLNQSNALDRW